MNNHSIKDVLICPVCLEELKHVRSLFCGHTLCMACAFSCVTNKNECPVCRMAISSSPALHTSEQHFQTVVDGYLNNKSTQEIQLLVEENLKCGVCQNVAKGPVQTYCKHLFCKKCLADKLQLEMKCPQCNLFLPMFVKDIREHLLIKTIIESNTFKNEKIFFQICQTVTFKCLPAMVFDSTITIGFEKEIKVFEPRYLSLIEMVMEGSQSFCISSSSGIYPHFADLVKIKKIRSQTILNRRYYELLVECVDRIQIQESYLMINPEIKLDEVNFKRYPESLWIVDGEIFHDNYDMGKTGFDDLKEIGDIYEEFQDTVINNNQQATFSSYFGKFDDIRKQKIWEGTGSIDMEGISKFSLKTIQFLNLNPKEKAYFYYSNNLGERLRVINKHLSFVKQMLRSKLIKKGNEQSVGV